MKDGGRLGKVTGGGIILEANGSDGKGRGGGRAVGGLAGRGREGRLLGSPRGNGRDEREELPAEDMVGIW